MLLFLADGQGVPWSEHLHPLVQTLLVEEGWRFAKCNTEVARLLQLVQRQKSMWTNAKQQMAQKMQQNLEVSTTAFFHCVLFAQGQSNLEYGGQD